MQKLILNIKNDLDKLRRCVNKRWNVQFAWEKRAFEK